MHIGNAIRMGMYQHDSESAFRFVLRGELCDDAAQELRWAWETAKSILSGKELIIDVSEVTNADPLGLELLVSMRQAGARLTARKPVACPEVLRELEVPQPAQPRRLSSLAAIWRRWSNNSALSAVE